MQTSAYRLARSIDNATGGRITLKVFASGELVRPSEIFDAVQAGLADMFHTHEGFYERKSRAFHFFSGVPFGLTANEMFAWVRFGGGQELWDELSRQFNVKSLHCSNTGAQMRGWFVQEITSLESFRGLRYRMPEPGAEVLRRLGAAVVAIPGAEIGQALKSGAIEASEFVGPWMNMAMGLHEAAGFYYYPGWHEPGTALTLGINSQVWEGFDESDRQLIEALAAGEFALSLAEFNTNNALSLRRLRDEGAVRIMKFDDAILNGLREISQDVVAEMGSEDDLARKIHASIQEFRTSIKGWTDISESAYARIR